MRMPQTCGNENSDITCSFFFRTIDNAFRDETVLYTLRKSFFPTQGAPPASFDVFMTLSIESVPDISCNDPYFKERSINSPPSMSEVCSSSSAILSNWNGNISGAKVSSVT